MKYLFFLLSIFLSGVYQAQSAGGVTTGAALYCDSLNSGFISLTGYTGNVLYWESSNNNGTTWEKIQNFTSTQSYNHLQKTTSFRAAVQDGNFPPFLSTVSSISVHVPGNGGKLKGGGLFCVSSGTGSLVLNFSPGQVLFYEKKDEDGAWINLPHKDTIFNYADITKDTKFRAVVSTIPGCPSDTSTIASFSVDAQTIAGSILNADSVCYGTAGDTLKLSAYRGDILGWYTSKDNGLSWLADSVKQATLNYTTVTQNISYKVEVKNGSCPTFTTAPVSVAVYNKNIAYAGEDKVITKHDYLRLDGRGNGTPIWDNANTLDDAQTFHPQASPQHSTQYVLTLTDLHGCISSDTVQIDVIVPIPTAITPNGDGANDLFLVDDIHLFPENKLTVFNRWGTIVYNAAPYTNNWDGKSDNGHNLPDDLYYFIFDYGNGEKPFTNYILIKR